MSNLAATNPDIHVLEQLMGVFRRRWKAILACILAGLVLGYLYAQSQVPQYAASATVLVRSGFAADPMRQGIQTTTPEEEGQFLSQLELVKSASVAALVAAKLNLEEDAAFNKPAVSGVARLVSRLEQRLGFTDGNKSQANQTAVERDAVVARLQAGVKALRAGRTYVAAISFTHSNPEIAQVVAQAYAEAFRQKLSEASDLANSRVRATIEGEISRATGEAKSALEQKYHETVIARALPGMDAVIISDAKKPVAPIAPRKGFLLAVGAILGAAFGCLLTGWLELRDRGVRDGDRLAARLGTRFFGYGPEISGYRKGVGSSDGTSFAMPEEARWPISNPFSRFSETIRSAAVAVSKGIEEGRGQVVAIISVLPGEGKTLIAGNLASQLANQGRKVLLIDGHFRDPDLTGWLAGKPASGLVDRVLHDKPANDTTLFDQRNNVSFLPAATNGRTVEPASVFTGSQMAKLVETERGVQDVILIDLPSLASASDASAIEPLIDRYILVSEWGGAPQELIETVLKGEPTILSKLAGVIITKTNLRRLGKYVDSRSRGAFQYRIG
ncbi:hypothetical protein JJB09_23700 [Rhizobium sp. KVB221]|uniref:Polysaccharide chain length determinant N-terminal domain-containing protein n=1 Tax=Rhizobium setariae TaxID=2801340 RepID=A0A937CQW3_9HYPH|nr:Wzz/FepE/Etk N-terminal domain-containing protein [Rhizobium setariae]MBL0375024.1 hypothetical protein [Rhizobium setariae]